MFIFWTPRMQVASVSEIYGLFACGLTGHARASLLERVNELGCKRANEDEFVRALQLRANLTSILLLFGELELLRACHARGMNALQPLTTDQGDVFMTAHEIAVYHADRDAFEFLNDEQPEASEEQLGDLERGVELFHHMVLSAHGMRARLERGESARNIRRAILDRTRKTIEYLFPGHARNMNLYKRFMSPFSFVRLARALGLSCCIFQSRELVAEFEQQTPRRRMVGVDQSARDMEGPRCNVSARVSEDLGPIMFTSNPVPVRDVEGTLVSVRVALITGRLINPYLIRTLVETNDVALPVSWRPSDAREIYVRDAELRGEALFL